MPTPPPALPGAWGRGYLGVKIYESFCMVVYVVFGPGWVKIPTPGRGGVVGGWVGRQAGTQKCLGGTPGVGKK